MKKVGIVIVSAVLIIILLSIFFSVSQIAGTAMEPTIHNGQLVIFKTIYPTLNVHRSNIVFYRSEGAIVDHIGRIIGLPSESIYIGNGNVYIDDMHNKYKIHEEYLPADVQTYSYQENQWFKLGEYEYLILKDNREENTVNIEQSIIHKSDITGKLIFAL
jgi:signal peptidase I